MSGLKVTDIYDDIIERDPPVSLKHKKMDRLNRAAQFAPFAALTGYEDAIRKVTDEVNSREDYK